MTEKEVAGDVAAAETERPAIKLEPGGLHEAATFGEQFLKLAGVPIFQRGNALVRPILAEVRASGDHRTKVAQLHPVDAAWLRDKLTARIAFFRFDRRRDDYVPCNAPLDVANTILARVGEWKVPVVTGVISAPTMRPDGSLLTQQGYDAATGLYLAGSPALPAMPDEPTRGDALQALDRLTALLDEFPIIGAASQAVAVSALLTPIARGAFPAAPMHCVSAPAPGSGKSFFIDVVAAIATGQRCPVLAPGRNEEETEKRLGAAMLSGQPLVSIDNVNGLLGGTLLCQAVERPVIEIRRLGESTNVRVETTGTSFFSTGNNLTLTGDLTRRALLMQLDPVLENPELREFTGNPFDQVLADRGRYVGAALTIVRAYIVAGRPDPAKPLASFEGWSNIVRSALLWCGLADPVETMTVARSADPQLAALGELLCAWADALGLGPENARTADDVLQAAGRRRPASDGSATPDGDSEWDAPALRKAVLPIAASRQGLSARTLGRFFTRHKGRIVGGFRICGEPDGHGHPIRWHVEFTG